MPYRLQELIDASQVQAFLDSFSGVAGIPTAILGRDGSTVAMSGWRDICLDYHQAHPESLQCCLDSNARVMAALEKGEGLIRYTCPHGFMKAAFALVVDGEHLGTMLTGQMLLEPPDEEQFLTLARRFGFDEESYLAALRAVPVMEPQQVDRNLACLQQLTDLVVSIANSARREKVSARSSDLFARRYASILETTADGFWIIDGTGRCLEANAVCAANLGYSLEELRGMSLREVDGGETTEEMATRTAAIKREGFGRFEALHRRKDGTLMEVEVSTSYIVEEDLFIAFIRDISREKQAAAELQASEERFRLLYERAPMPYQSLDADGRILDVNPAWLQMSGYGRDEVIGRPIADLLTAESVQLLQERFPRFVATGGVHDAEFQFRRKDGEAITVVVEGRIGYDLHGAFKQTHCMLYDVTERKRAEEEIRLLNEQLEQRVSERTAELESFCYSISHDLRAPLRAIDGFTRILREEYEPRLDDLGKDLCSRISGNAVRMGALIDDLLAFSRTGRTSLEPEQLDMTLLVRSVFEEVLPEEGRDRVQLQLEQLPVVVADRTTLRQVWVNLLDNALKYSSRQAQAVIKVGGRLEGNKVVYYVRDNGVGFNMDYANKLFGVFLRAHSPSEFPGTGVGLAIVERIIHRHGGRVWAEGEEGRGATFYFSLPA
jgi:hypothetical protein